MKKYLTSSVGITLMHEAQTHTRPFRNLQIQAKHWPLARHVQLLTELTDELGNLQNAWDNLSLLGELTNIGTEISNTREDFQTLANELGNCLIDQSVNKVIENLNARAQSCIDILVRNLFERTADIGFLSTDPQLTQTCEIYQQRGLSENEQQSTSERLRDYQAKYSVYNNILLLDAQGALITDLENRYATGSVFDWIAEGVNQSAAYFESYRYLQPGLDESKSLIYAWKIEESHRTVGYVCLCFNLTEEKDALLIQARGSEKEGHQVNWVEFGVIDQNNQIVFSSDLAYLRPGTIVALEGDRDWGLTKIGPISYITCILPTQGYQGYMGPNWRGFAVIPLEHAFEAEDTEDEEIKLPAISWTEENKLLDSRIIHIKRESVKIQKQLNQSVWNGNINQKHSSHQFNESFSKTLLWEISKAGDRTRDLFNRSVQQLIKTFTQRLMKQQENNAKLAINLMDRNLYERANDCRWWALNDVYRQCLLHRNEQDLLNKSLEALKHTNGLYTVYTDILLFDENGCILANSGERNRAGEHIEESWLAPCLSLRDQNHYVVSSFAKTSLYENRQTYIYAAAIYDNPNNPGAALGGIAVVFDSEPQFEAILNEVAANQNVQTFSFIIDQQKNLISSNTNKFNKNGQLDIPLESWFKSGFRQNESGSFCIEFEGQVYCVGLCNSGSYREYKSEADAYENNLICVYLSPVGMAADLSKGEKRPTFDVFRLNAAKEETLEIATFKIADRWFAFPSEEVVEAIIPKCIAKTPGKSNFHTGSIIHKDRAIPIIDLAALLNLQLENETNEFHSRQVLLLQTHQLGSPIGVLVDDLGEIPNVPRSKIHAMDTHDSRPGLVKGLVQTRDDMLGLLRTEDYEKLLIS